MKKLNDLEYLKLGKFAAFWYRFKFFFLSTFPLWFLGLFRNLWKSIKGIGVGIKNQFVDIVTTFTKGNWAVKLSFLIFGFGNIYYGQILRGIGFLLFELVFIAYMILPTGGAYWLSKVNWFQTGNTVGDIQREEVVVGEIDYGGIKIELTEWIDGDDSAKVLLYGLLTVIFIIAFIVTWRMQVKQCRINMDIVASGKKVRSGKQDLQSLLDDQFHKTLLAPSLIGILLFTILPTIFMVLVAFTNYDAAHNGFSNLFSWVGWDNFNKLLGLGNGDMGVAFGEVLAWTLMWAFFATFSNYFLGMFVAIMINKKGIKFKKVWRTVLVMTIAIPQFVSLLYVSNIFGQTGYVGKLLEQIPAIAEHLSSNRYMSVWSSPVISRILVILINIWIGIPYIMLMATGILMNIPEDLYESARIDGASGYQQFTKITLPYMLFVTGPYLLTSFVGNLNNFNVIYLLSGGGPPNSELGVAGGVRVGYTDLLITWLYKMTLDSPDRQYNSASVIGILIFIVVAILSLVIYNVIPSTKNEEDYS